jgi:monoamine oxidase
MAKASSKQTAMNSADVIILGAGLAGLSAARALRRAGKSVLVLEARDRVGGRSHTEQHGDVFLDRGGAWIGPTQNRMAELAEEYGIELLPQPTDGKNVYVAGAKRREHGTRFLGVLPLGSVPPDISVLPDLAWLSLQLNRLSRQVPVNAPWKARRAKYWDNMTLAEWLRRNARNPLSIRLASASFEAIWGAEARDISFLYALHYVACAGNEKHRGTFERLINDRNAAQDTRFAKGSQALVLAMAAELGFTEGMSGSDTCIRLNCPVLKVEQNGCGVQFHTDQGIFNAPVAIVAVPPPMRARLDLLPRGADASAMTVQPCPPMGAIVKCVAIYDRPFWRERGLNGQAVLDHGIIKTTFDVSPPPGPNGQGQGALLGFIGGDGARQWKHMSAAAQREQTLSAFARCFGAEAMTPVEWISQDWTTDAWTGGGGPTVVAPPGWITAHGAAYAEPQGAIHFAGTECAGYWTGYMEGAVRSGERAAKVILEDVT